MAKENWEGSRKESWERCRLPMHSRWLTEPLLRWPRLRSSLASLSCLPCLHLLQHREGRPAALSGRPHIYGSGGDVAAAEHATSDRFDDELARRGERQLLRHFGRKRLTAVGINTWIDRHDPRRLPSPRGARDACLCLVSRHHRVA